MGNIYFCGYKPSSLPVQNANGAKAGVQKEKAVVQLEDNSAVLGLSPDPAAQTSPPLGPTRKFLSVQARVPPPGVPENNGGIKKVDLIIPLNEDIEEFKLENKRLLGEAVVHSLDNTKTNREEAKHDSEFRQTVMTAGLD